MSSPLTVIPEGSSSNVPNHGQLWWWWGGGEMVKRREKESKGGFNEATSSALTARPAFSSQIPVLLVDGPS